MIIMFIHIVCSSPTNGSISKVAEIQSVTFLMGNKISQPVPDYELLLSGYFRDDETHSIIPLTIVEICIQYCSSKHLCFLLLCTGSTHYNYQQYNQLKLYNLQNNSLYSLHIKHIHPQLSQNISSIHEQKTMDGGMYTKCVAVSNLKLPQYLLQIINKVTINTTDINEYDVIFRYARGQYTDFDLIAFNTNKYRQHHKYHHIKDHSEIYQYVESKHDHDDGDESKYEYSKYEPKIDKNELKSDEIMAYRISLPSLPSTHIDNKIIYNEYTQQFICVGGMYWWSSYDGRYSNLEDSKSLFTLKLNDFNDMEELKLAGKHKKAWKEFNKCPREKNSLCVIGDKYKSLLMMLGSKYGSGLCYTYNINDDYKAYAADDNDNDDDDDEDDELSERVNVLNKMGQNRSYPGLCYEEITKRVFCGEQNVVEIYDVKKNKWRKVWRRTQREYFYYPALWTHPINPNVLFIAGNNEFIDDERCYLYQLGQCEWCDLRSNQQWKILNDESLLKMFELDGKDVIKDLYGFPIFNRSIFSMTETATFINNI